MDRNEREPRAADDEIEPDVVPEDAPRGGVTVPSANDPGTTTPPIGGWGETLPEAEDEANERGEANDVG